MKDDLIYGADIDNYEELNNVVSIPLVNGLGNHLILQVVILDYLKVRLTIKEPDNPRFMLKTGWALEEEPIPQPYVT